MANPVSRPQEPQGEGGGAQALRPKRRGSAAESAKRRKKQPVGLAFPYVSRSVSFGVLQGAAMAPAECGANSAQISGATPERRSDDRGNHGTASPTSSAQGGRHDESYVPPMRDCTAALVGCCISHPFGKKARGVGLVVTNAIPCIWSAARLTHRDFVNANGIKDRRSLQS